MRALILVSVLLLGGFSWEKAQASEACRSSSVKTYKKTFVKESRLDMQSLFGEIKGKRLSRKSMLSILQNIVHNTGLEKSNEILELLNEDNSKQIFNSEFVEREDRLMEVYVSDSPFYKKPIEAFKAVVPQFKGGFRISFWKYGEWWSKNFNPQHRKYQSLVGLPKEKMSEGLEQRFIIQYREPLILSEADLYSSIQSSLFAVQSALFFRSQLSWSPSKVLAMASLRKFYSQVLRNSLLVIESDLSFKRNFLIRFYRVLRKYVSLLAGGVYNLREENDILRRLAISPKVPLVVLFNKITKLQARLILLFCLDGLAQFSNGMIYFSRELSFEDGLPPNDSVIMQRLVENAAANSKYEHLRELEKQNYRSDLLLQFIEDSKLNE